MTEILIVKIITLSIGILFTGFLIYIFTWEWFMTIFFGTIIEVSQEDIDTGVKSNDEFCPIALAVERKLKEKYPDSKFKIKPISVFVEGIQIYYNEDKTRVFYHNPKQIEMAKFILNFDNGEAVKPFNFKLWL